MDCPHNCAHCYQVQNGRARKRSLRLDEAINRINQLKKLGVQEIIPVTGEILWHPEYMEVFRVADCTEYLITNGLRLITERRLGAAITRFGLQRLRVSAHYESPRNFGADMGNFTPAPLEMIPKIVNAAACHGIGVEAFCLIGTFNYQNIARLFDKAMKDGLEKLVLINLMPVNESVRQFCLNRAQIQTVFAQVEEIRGRDPENRFRLGLLGNFGPRAGSKYGPALAQNGCYCPAGVDKAYITVDGSVYGCHFMLDAKLRIGRLEDGRFQIEKEICFDRSNCYFLQNG